MANSLGGPWKELEDVKPSLLKASRKIKVLFTGDLNKPVISNPWFNGKESDLLRCQIARISHNITIIPNVKTIVTNQESKEINCYKIGSDKREIEPVEDPLPLPSINDVLNIKNWVHFLPAILNEGRIVHAEKEPPTNMDPDEFKAKVIADDPFEDRLKKIVDDKAIKCPIPNLLIPAWKLAYCYDDKIYTNPYIAPPTDDETVKKDDSINNTIVHLRSLIWPGAHVIRIKGQTQYLYFGWGNKYNDDSLEDRFVFTSFPKIESELQDLPVGEEPNGVVEELDTTSKNNQ